MAFRENIFTKKERMKEHDNQENPPTEPLRLD